MKGGASAAVTLALVLAAIVPSPAFAAEWTYCEEHSGLVQISNVTITPEFPTPGSVATIAIDGVTDVEVADASVGVSVSLFGLPLQLQEARSLCEFAETCPVPAGPFFVSLDENLPTFTPPGDYTLRLDINPPAGTSTGVPMLCLLIEATVASA